MDISILLATMLLCFLIGMPIAYSLAMAAIVGALWIGIPLEAVMLKISDGVSKVAMLTIPFFVLAGAIMRRAAWPGAWSRLPTCWSD
jgi:TRAP-type mannitol/chloroaromatic compound transport system permease large subunit